MLTTQEIKQFIDEDNASMKKKFARTGQAYYDNEPDIKDYRLFYYNTEGILVEDKYRSNIRIPHNFFAELVDQATQYMLSGKDGIIKSDLPELQTELDSYFNDNEDFKTELSELISDCQIKGASYLFAYKNADNKTAFQCADSLGVVEVRAKDTDTNAEHVIYWYVDRIEKGTKKIKRIQVWDSQVVEYFVQDGEGNIEKDLSEPINPKPHTLYQKDDSEKTYYEEYGFIPFFRLDNNKKQESSLKSIKELIDDYNLVNCGLSNNIADFDTPIHVVKGFEGDNLDELQVNLKTKKLIGMEATDAGAGVEVHTVDIPYQARVAKLELDEKSIYKFGFGLNIADLKDSSSTTNVAIKTAYSRLDLKVNKLEDRVKQILRKIIKVVLDEINKENGTDYQQKDVWFDFKHEIMANELENAQIKQIEAQTQQVKVGTILNVATQFDAETVQKQLCEALDLDWDDLKDKLPVPNEAENELTEAQTALNNIPEEV